ncbi:NDP-glycosyltransferase YjiC-like [Oppia nitens]|uniref:NDP-glycosyltransferase YjiC-like n=1 Tax=Oppia nitens TaxID=1686743 RepID=UPI0023DA441C|nr:NDP-glycosyltransferase YjiC-like [Oppia nitens]
MVTTIHVVIISHDGVGHVNACLAVAERLIQVGHRVSFVVNEQWKGRLEPYGVREVLVNDPQRNSNVDPARDLAEKIVKMDLFEPNQPLVQAMEIFEKFAPQQMETAQRLDIQLVQLLPELKPDIIFIDYAVCFPAVVNYGCPWINVVSMNPLYYIDDDRAPPSFSGLSEMGDKTEWKQFRDAVSDVKRKSLKLYNNYFKQKGITDYTDDSLVYNSKYLNIYGFPEELDYLELRPLPPKWHRFDNLMRREKHIAAFELSDKLKEKPGKLIYFSLGSMGAANVKNMNRLIDILSKSNNRFIVSMGPMPEAIHLAENMWGQSNVQQIQVLPLVDLVITHGGNNTTTETFYFGKPMIVLPLGGDQLDNAQRVQDLGLGVRLDAYKCTNRELLTAIDTLLNDNILTDRLKQISLRIQSDDMIEKTLQ